MLGIAASCGAPEVKYQEETGGSEASTGARASGGDDDSGGSGTGAGGGDGATGGGGGVVSPGGAAGRAGAGGPGETGGEGGGTEDGGTGGTGGAAPETCENDALDGDETAADCGGSCEPCDNGLACEVNGDCVSGACIGLVCADPGCDNGLIDPNEGGTDCGGVCPDLCPTGEPCDVDGDCESGVCTSRVCVEASCTDLITNGEETDIDCGGANPACARCAVGDDCLVDGDCETGSCVDASCALVCPANFDDCDGDAENGCEANLLTNLNHCGACARRCSLPHAVSACSAGECIIATDAEGLPRCTAPFAACDADTANGCEATLLSDPENCGGCGIRCTDANGTPTCVDGVCGSVCNAGFADCGGDYRCETNTTTSVAHCGGCGRACPAEEGSPWCQDSECGFTVCAPGTGDCDGNGTCETNLNTSDDHCGSCGNACNPQDGTGNCAAGTCEIVDCDDGFGDCDEEYDNGCEQSLTTLDHCAACDTPCARDNAAATCETGTCTFVGCNTNYGNCDANTANGCETDLRTTVNHCGACGEGCELDHAVEGCANSACTIVSCNSGYDDCDGFVVDGCEAALLEDEVNCGQCGRSCGALHQTQCTSGSCSNCEDGYADCGGATDGCETQLGTLTNCASCGNSCTALHQTQCVTGICQTCAAGWGDCTTAAGCETNTDTSASHCGVCDNACSAIHMTACTDGRCNTCASGWEDCNSNPGCETNITADPNCGGCGIDCQTNVGTSANPCTNSACVPVCNTGYGDCNSSRADGCEESLTNDAQNCGACGVNCSGSTPYCVNVSGSTWACRGYLDIVAVNYMSGTGSATTTVSHTMATAESASANQMILVGVASYGNSLAGAKPSSVKYNNVTMTKVGTTDYYQNNSYAGVYYLLDADLPGAGTYNVVSTKSDPHGTVLNIIELTGVNQAAPAANGGATFGNCGSADPISTIVVGAVGSWTYDIGAAFGGNTGGTALAGPQGAPAATKTVDVLGSDSMLGIGGYRGPYSTTGSYTGVGWSLTSCNGGAHVIVAIERGSSG